MSSGRIRLSPAVWLTSYGLSLLGKGIVAVVLPAVVPHRPIARPDPTRPPLPPPTPPTRERPTDAHTR